MVVITKLCKPEDQLHTQKCVQVCRGLHWSNPLGSAEIPFRNLCFSPITSCQNTSLARDCHLCEMGWLQLPPALWGETMKQVSHQLWACLSTPSPEDEYPQESEGWGAYWSTNLPYFTPLPLSLRTHESLKPSLDGGQIWHSNLPSQVKNFQVRGANWNNKLNPAGILGKPGSHEASVHMWGVNTMCDVWP